ncbi:Asp-tRNA(Asn)/Glu-tRNA(Gln) amidotransferase subunit GatC [Melioribacter sp. OK-6-Me]|uniref:Asp-tRNA(Asn)/Glu-tRNA(Gln) amidotransferase subunit GatC n=1 Tax=unclassified Melioribacter TaxID=2627329 RepID=UPI003ED9DADD
MSVTKREVEYIARLARLRFNDEELESYTAELNEILNYMEKLNELNTETVEPLSHPIENVNVFREDKLVASIDRADALKNAPSRDEEFFKVPKVINK